MGFLDKMKATAKDLGKAAKDVKGELEKSGLLDAVKQGGQQPQSETYYDPATGAQPYEESVQLTNRELIKQVTGVDVANLLTDEQVTQLTGITVERQGDDGGAENMTGPYWRGTFKRDNYSFGAYLFHDYIGDPGDDLGLNEDGARTRMEETRALTSDMRNLPGVGDDAITDGNYVYARKGRWTIITDASGDAKTYDYEAAARNLAIQVFNNLPA